MSENNNENNAVIDAGEDDILNDVRNLFIQEDTEEEKTQDTKSQQLQLQPMAPVKAPITSSEPKVIEPAHPKARVIFESKNDEGKGKQKEKDTELIEKPSKQQPVNTAKSGCNSNSDCDKNSYCSIKSGKCLIRLSVGQSGCASNDQCANAVCLGKKCIQPCGNDSDCIEGNVCSILKDLNIFKGLDSTLSLKGVCKMGNKPALTQASASSNSKKHSLAVVSAISALSIVGLILVFIYLRSRLRRRNRNNNPDMFLFNKLQRSASQNGLVRGTGSNGSVALSDQLNSKLSSVGGARFTRWAALGEQENQT